MVLQRKPAAAAIYGITKLASAHVRVTITSDTIDAITVDADVRSTGAGGTQVGHLQHLRPYIYDETLRQERAIHCAKQGVSRQAIGKASDFLQL